MDLEERRKKVQELRRELANYYVEWVSDPKAESPRTLDDFLAGTDGPPSLLKEKIVELGKEVESFLESDSQDEHAVTKSPPPPDPGAPPPPLSPDPRGPASGSAGNESNKDKEEPVMLKKDIHRITGVQLDNIAEEKFVGDLSRRIREHGEDITKLVEERPIYKEVGNEVVASYIKAGMKSTVFTLAEGLEFVQNHHKSEMAQHRILLLKGIKAVFSHYIRTYLEWGIEWGVIPDRAPAKALQRIAFNGYDFDGLLRELNLDLSVKRKLDHGDPADPVRLYAEILWNGTLASTAFNMFPDTPLDISERFAGQSYILPQDVKMPEQFERLKESDYLLDSETNGFIDEIYDSFFQCFGYTPIDSGIKLGSLLKSRFLETALKQLDQGPS